MGLSTLLAFLFFFRLSGSLRLPNLRLIPNCPSTYSIQGGNSNTLKIDVKNIVNGCEKIMPVAARRNGAYSTDSALNPIMTIGSFRDKKVVNISWNSTIIGNKYPKRYLLELTKYNRYGKLSTSCVLLRIRNRKVKNSKTYPKMFFDCVELDPERGIYLSVQVWSLPNRKTAVTSCPTSRRQKRSVPLSKNCSTVRGKVYCSESKLFLLSLDDRIPGICHCSDPPKLSLTRLQNGSFRINTWNLPQYARTIKVRIINEGNEVYYRNLNGTKSINESRSIITDKTFGPGNYITEVDAVCAGGYDDIRQAGNDCPTMDPVQLNSSFEDSNQDITKPPTNETSIHNLIAILGGALLCLITVTVFCCLIQKRRKHTETMIPMPSLLDTSRRVQEDESFLELAKLKEEKMLLYHPDNEDHIECVRQLQILCKAYGCKLVTDTTDTDTALYMESKSTNAASGTNYIAYNTDIADNENIKENTDFMVNTETTINTRPAINWRDFAEMAGTDFTEIVMIMSPGLYRICRTYQSRFSDLEDFDNLRRARHYEIIPCVVMQKLQTLIQENHQNCKFSVHFVSFGEDSNLIEDFLNTFDFFKRGSNYFVYCLSEYHRNNCSSENNLRLNKTDLKRLFRRLKGLTDNEIEQSDLDSMFSNQSFGALLSQALSLTSSSHVDNLGTFSHS